MSDVQFVVVESDNTNFWPFMTSLNYGYSDSMESRNNHKEFEIE